MTDLHARPGLPAPGSPVSDGPAAHAPSVRPVEPRPTDVFRSVPCWVVLAVVVALGVADLPVAALLPAPAGGVAGYELVAALAKGPVFVALMVALIGLPALSTASPGAARDAVHRRVLARSVRTVVPATAVVATVPAGGLAAGPASWLAPGSGSLLWLAVAGLGLATTTVLAVALLALRAWFALVLALAGAAVLLAEAVATGLELGRAVGSAVDGLAGGAAVGAGAGAVLVATVWLRRRPRRARLGTAARRGLVYGAVVVGVLTLVRPVPGLWATVVVVLVIGLAVPPLLTTWVLARIPAPTPPSPAPASVAEPVTMDPYATVTVGPRRDALSVPRPGLRILHLAGDDPDAPGAGAEAQRVAEIDRRLAAAGHRITVVCRRHRGVVDRTEHHRSGSQRGWVQWVHPARGLVGYAVAAGICARAHDADLVMEEFLAPFATVAAPRWTARPVLGVASWFDVDPSGRRLRDVVRRWAIRRHRSVVAVSVDVARAVVAVHPRAEVVVIGHGVRAGAPSVARGDDVVCTAPLHVEPKGLDLLLDAWARVAADLPGRLILTGTGPQNGAVRARIRDLGLDERVVLTGAGTGTAAATAALASARVAVVPSRYEASGVAALAALAVGTPVVATDLSTLREVVPAEGGVLVPRSGDDAADAAGFARALWALYSDDRRRARAARWGPELARSHDWDTLAGMQDDVCRAVAGPAAARRT